MELFSIYHNLDSKLWEKKDVVPPDNMKEIGYSEYHVTRPKANSEDGTFTYYLSTDTGDVKVATLKGLSGKSDPLKEVNKCYLLIEDMENIELEDKKAPGLIKGIAIDDDWVECRR